MILLSVFALLALLLAAVGIAGVVGYTVVQRSQEIGVRMALGAQPRDVLRLVVGQSLTWMAAGLVVGFIASLGLVRMLGSLLFGVTPTDPVVLGSVAVVLAVVTIRPARFPRGERRRSIRSRLYAVNRRRCGGAKRCGRCARCGYCLTPKA